MRAAQHVIADPSVFCRVHPKIVDRKVATSAIRKLGEAVRRVGYAKR
jgi:hypothetical protein